MYQTICMFSVAVSFKCVSKCEAKERSKIQINTNQNMAVVSKDNKKMKVTAFTECHYIIIKNSIFTREIEKF